MSIGLSFIKKVARYVNQGNVNSLTSPFSESIISLTEDLHKEILHYNAFSFNVKTSTLNPVAFNDSDINDVDQKLDGYIYKYSMRSGCNRILSKHDAHWRYHANKWHHRNNNDIHMYECISQIGKYLYSKKDLSEKRFLVNIFLDIDDTPQIDYVNWLAGHIAIIYARDNRLKSFEIQNKYYNAWEDTSLYDELSHKPIILGQYTDKHLREHSFCHCDHYLGDYI